MTLIAKRLAPLLALGVLCACASDPAPRPGRGYGGEARAGRGLPNLFISPAGEPFRAERGRPYPVSQWFARANLTHDGRLTEAQFQTDAASFFNALDANHDGVIDGFELQHYERDVAPEINPEIQGLQFGEGMDLALGSDRQEQGPMIGRSRNTPKEGAREVAGDRRPEGAGLYGLLNEPEPVAAADLSFNSRITLQEFLETNDRRFHALDPKGLGYLTLEGLPKTPAQTVLEKEAKRRRNAEGGRPSAGSGAQRPPDPR